MAHQDSQSESGGHHDEFHVVPAKFLIATGAALIVLTVVTVTIAEVDFAKWDLKELNIWVALGVAAVKASLVCLFFMHLRWDRPFNGFVIVASIAFVVLFIGFAMTDSFEYRPEIDQYIADELDGGDAPEVQKTLAELGE
jgi:cytochrome c oxidase subunit 4